MSLCVYFPIFDDSKQLIIRNMAETKLERSLRLMRLMAGNVNYTVDELARRMDISYRSIYRYFKTFELAGFEVYKIGGSVYKLGVINHRLPDVSKLVFFSDEEARVVGSLIDSLTDDIPFKRDLQRKLATIYDHMELKRFVGEKSNSTNTLELGTAIKEQRKVILHAYESSNSGVIRDRLVEPFGFTPNYVQIWAFDLEDRKNKLFRVSRIDWVEVFNEAWTENRSHKKGYLDAFRMASFNRIPVKLEMTLRAKNLLVEEFPMAEKDIRKKGGRYIYESHVAQMEGIGRFVCGLMDDIRMIDSPELQKYLDDYFDKVMAKRATQSKYIANS